MILYYYHDEYQEDDFSDVFLELIHNRFTASEFCQILYERSYDMFKKWLSEINKNPKLVDKVLIELNSNNINDLDEEATKKRYLEQEST